LDFPSGPLNLEVCTFWACHKLMMQNFYRLWRVTFPFLREGRVLEVRNCSPCQFYSIFDINIVLIVSFYSQMFSFCCLFDQTWWKIQ
jgi:hypothetical protein